jgi:hypothetical protein
MAVYELQNPDVTWQKHSRFAQEGEIACKMETQTAD